MEKKKGINFIWLVIGMILGGALLRDFDFKTFRFRKPALDIVYLITFIATIYLIVKDYKKQPEK